MGYYPTQTRGSRRKGVLPKSRSVPVLGHSTVETNVIAGFFVRPTDGMRAVCSAFVFGQHARKEALEQPPLCALLSAVVPPRGTQVDALNSVKES